MALTVKEAIARVPAWRDASDLKVTALGGGITNKNYRVDLGDDSYVLRIVGANTNLLGINREHEYAANLAAGKLGIAPQVFYFIQPEGCLVTRFIKGRPLPPAELKKTDNLRKLAGMLKNFHSQPPIPGVFWVPQIVRDYAQLARQHQVTFPENFDWLIERLEEAEAAFASDPLPHRPCHNDLLNENFLVENEHIYILDWEYAGMGDLYFDLANLSVNHEFSDEEDQQLLTFYFGEVSEKHWARLKVMRIISDYRESMWGLVQIGISELDFNFRGYADRHFNRLTGNLNDPRWQEWLSIIKS
ncbi:MAG TPA: choline/ethanolamine kinase family protein [Anaerolineales bacterium]|nr:choline/ethanolamine kinase family protein [Anaerolineales bacterium]